jgi:RNA polymerase sigma-70 factor (ECF subfamily)
VSTGYDDYRDFVAARSPALLRTATLLAGGNLGAGEDLLQDALAEVYRRWRRIDEPQAREAYTRRVLVRMATKTWGRRARERQRAVSVLAPTTSIEQATIDRLDLRRYLCALPASQRAVLVLRYYEDLSEAQIADLMGTPTGTVKSRASTGLQTLKRLMEAADPDPEPRNEATR